MDEAKQGRSERQSGPGGAAEPASEHASASAEAAPAAKPGQLAFGLERIGLVSLVSPLLVGLVVVALSVAAAFGVARIRVDDSLSQLFRSDSAEFRQFEELSRRFPSSEFDVLVVVEGPALLERSSLEAMRNLAADVQLIDGVNGIISIFSARQPPAPGQLPAPLFPEDLPEGADFAQLIERVRTNEIIRGKLLSEDGQLALIVLSLDQTIVEREGLRDVVGEIRRVVEEDIGTTGLRTQLSGVPVMQLEIRNAVERDRLLYNAIGFAAGCLIAVLFFRRVGFVIMAAAPPLVAILWSLGLLGWLDFRLNMFLNVITPLIMVMGFSDSMQITFAARDRLLAGDSTAQALRSAILVVGPACVVTVATAALSFIALLFADSHLIRTFGAAGALATLISYVAVITLVPLFGILLLRGRSAFTAQAKGNDSAVDALRHICGWVADHMVRRPVLYSALSLLLVGGLLGVYAGLEPRYRLADQVPDREQAVEASGRLDAKLAGANPIHVLIEFPKGASLYGAETLQAIAAVHDVVEHQAGVGNVWSLETLRRWLAEKAGITDIAVLKEYVDILPQHLTRRFISVSEDAVVVTGRIPDRDINELLPVVDTLDKALSSVRDKHPGFRISVTGLSAIAARNSADMIGQLNQGLTAEMVFVAALIGLAFRSFFVVVVSILPGLFPIVASGAVLAVLGEGLQFASIVALTVAFGLGLDATIHYLNRLRLEEKPGEDPAEGIKRATVLVGPALILTSLVLACGLAVTVFSDLPSLRLFGWLSAFTLIAALIGDLLILPATVMLFRRVTRRASVAALPAGEASPAANERPAER
ncbi:MAG: MMPL family transporter [Pseudomonadota bacterium]|nr:MMPL family transporter [Pseudomonadota bacterium]